MTRLDRNLRERMDRFPLLASWSKEIEPQGERPTTDSDLKIWEGKEIKNGKARAMIVGYLLALVGFGVILDNLTDDDPSEYALVRAFYCKED